MSFTSRPIREERKSSARTRKMVLIGTSILEGAVHLYRRMRQRKEEEHIQERRIRILKLTVTILLSALLILLLLIGTLKLLIRVKAISLNGMISAVSAELPRDENGLTNVLLVGAGDDDHDGVDLTDTVMVASLDPKTHAAVMLSIPRDVYVLSTAEMGKGRINSLYRDYKSYLIQQGTPRSKAPGVALKQLGVEVGTLLGLPIHGVIKLNFSGFEETIDALGGIDIVVPEDLVDPEYPGPNYSYETFTLAKGPQHLDGATALKYARTRHSTSDFSRSGRQQQIITAASEKAKKAGLLTNIGRVSEILSIVAKNMETTFSSRELLGFVPIGRAMDSDKVVSMQLSDSNGLYTGLANAGGFLYAPPREQFEGASVLLPVSVPEFPVTWKQIQAFGTLIFGHREAFVRPPSIAILNAGAKEGSARSLGTEMIRYGFNVTETRNLAKAPNPALETSWIAINPALESPGSDAAMADRAKRAKFSALLLQKYLGIKPPTTIDPAAFAEQEADLVIVLGKDYRYTLLQDLVKTK